MIENVEIFNPKPGDGAVLYTDLGGVKNIAGLYMARGHVIVRNGIALPVMDGKTSISVFEETHPSKVAPALADPLRESGELSSVVFIPGGTNYYHFVIQNMPGLLLLDSRKLPKVVLATSRGFPASAHKLMTKLLPQLAGGRDVAIMTVPEGDYVARDVIFRSRPAAFVILAMARKILSMVVADDAFLAAAPAHSPAKLFIPRYGGINARNITNHEEVRAWFERRGYVTVNPGELPMEAQILLFARATHIVGVEGAALANLLFAANVKSVLILASPTTKSDTFFSGLAKQAGFALATLYGQIFERQNVTRNSDYYMPTDALDGVCRQLGL